MNATETFARHALETKLAAIPPEALSAAKTFILDSIGVGIAGAKAVLADEVHKTALLWGEASKDGAHVWGRGTFVPAPTAAFINGFQIHCQEYDCVHERAVVHPMATILSALVADTERKGGVTGADLLAAVIVAVDVAANLGIAVTSPIQFFRPANAGLFGATLGIARLRGFDLETAMNALGYALSHCSGTMQAHVEGKPALPIQIANASRSALIACDLAMAGIPGPHNVFEGPYGYFPLFEKKWNLQPVMSSLGKIWRISEVSHKPFPTGRAAQGGIVAVQQLRMQGVRAENLSRLELIAPPIIKRLVGRPVKSQMQVNYARLCFGYCGAIALLNGHVGLDDFLPERFSDPEILAIGNKISVIDDGTNDPAAFVPQTARAVLQDGTVRTVKIDHLYGSCADPLTQEAHLQKFRNCVAFGTAANEQVTSKLIEFVAGLEREPAAANLARLAAGLKI